jgi:Fe2+ transport system protein FeoA
LIDLEPGAFGSVIRVDGTSGFGKRLADMGFVPGARLELLRRGSPCVVRIGNSSVGLGSEHQREIVVAVT